MNRPVGYVSAMLCLLLAQLAVALTPSLPPLSSPSGNALFFAWARTHAPAPHPEPAYHYAADVWARLAPLVEERPAVIRPFQVGRTGQDTPIWGFRVSDPTVPVTQKLLVFANIHALEWVPTEAAVAFAESLALHPPAGIEVTVLPVLNPDGRAKVEADLDAGRNLYRRGNWENVDLNRDFAVNREATAVWKALIPNRYLTSPAPLSQPESRALDQLAATEHYAVSVSLHAFGGFIYYPWAGRWARAEDWRRFDALGRAMQAGMGPHAYRPRQLSRWGFFFRGQGMELDHLYGTYGTLAYLVETTRSGINPLKGDLKNYFRWYNPRDPEPHTRSVVGMLRALVVAMGEPLG